MADQAPGGGLSHLALYYRGRDEYAARVTAFARHGLRAGEPVLIAVPRHNADLLGQHLPAGSTGLSCVDMSELGRNPARIIPELRSFIDDHPGQRVRYVGEPAWPGRSAAEFSEAAIHEALIDLAFAGAAATILCPYDTAGLAAAVIADARRTHQRPSRDDRAGTAEVRPAAETLPGYGPPMPPPPATAKAQEYHADDLRPLRRMVRDFAGQAGLSEDRSASLVLAVSEIAANTLCHTNSGGLLRIWHTSQEVLCQLNDHGWITDPLAGRVHRPAEEHGQGLWVVNQECDLVELRSGPAGTTVRLHMRRPHAASAAPAPGGQPAGRPI
jgi:anti-sigma regulatory factor (Ser/Thr protein kinase)